MLNRVVAQAQIFGLLFFLGFILLRFELGDFRRGLQFTNTGRYGSSSLRKRCIFASDSAEPMAS